MTRKQQKQMPWHERVIAETFPNFKRKPAPFNEPGTHAEYILIKSGAYKQTKTRIVVRQVEKKAYASVEHGPHYLLFDKNGNLHYLTYVRLSHKPGESIQLPTSLRGLNTAGMIRHQSSDFDLREAVHLAMAIQKRLVELAP